MRVYYASTPYRLLALTHTCTRASTSANFATTYYRSHTIIAVQRRVDDTDGDLVRGCSFLNFY